MKFGMDEILTVIDKVKSTGLASFEYQDADTKIKIKGGAGKETVSCPAGQNTAENTPENGTNMPETIPTHEAAAVPEPSENSSLILSPMVGTFYTAPSEDEKPFVNVGDTLEKGQVVGIVEAMKLMNEIEADCDGIVEEILVKNEQMVEFGQPLIRVRKK